MGFGSTVSLPASRYMNRAAELGVGKGEASSVTMIFNAIVRIIEPRLLLALYQSPKTPAGTPFFVISGLALLTEVLHQIAVMVRKGRRRKKRKEPWRRQR